MPYKNYYIGIDLGTTNSVISWGRIDSRTNQLETNIIRVKMMDEHGGLSERQLLPSFVYFREDAQIIGEYAKFMYSRKPDKVVKSIKSKIGSNYSFKNNGSSFSPSLVSSMILKKLISSAKELLGFEPKEVIITVPASFDSDMRNATLEAAKLAGIITENPDGSPKNILLDEPRAALYDFINRQNKGEIPDSLIDFRTNKNVIVFDLGGGTLDVSLHKVFFNKTNGNVEIEDLAVSRYSKIGGDDFDELLANKFYEIFIKEHKLNITTDFDKEVLKAEFISFAEETKIKLSTILYEREVVGNNNSIPIEIEIMKGNVYQNKPFEYNLTVEDYESIISPLLGNNLSRKDVEIIASMEDNNNIIYPILDVLDKAKERYEKIPQIDAVILNGGMTKLYTIKKRIKDFFGIEPITSGDQDLSVAKGASVYHYNLTLGYKPTTILNETIGIETQMGYVRHLVQAGVVLPHKTKVLKDFTIATDGANYIDIPFYLGRSNNTDSPNRKIAERRVRFDKSLREGTAIELQISIDERNIIQLYGWEEGFENQKFIVENVSTDKIEQNNIVRKNYTIKTKSKIDDIPVGELLKCDQILLTLLTLYNSYFRHNDQTKSHTMAQIRKFESEITNSKNYEEFAKEIILILNTQQIFAKSRLIILLGNMAVKYPSIGNLVYNACISLIDQRRLQYAPTDILNNLIRPIIETIGKTGLNKGESKLIYLLNNILSDSLHQSLFISLGKIGHSANCVLTLQKYIDSSHKADRISVMWAYGKLGAREKENFIPIEHFLPIIDLIIRQLANEDHPEALKFSIYALGEICDRRFPNNDIVDEKTASNVINNIKIYGSVFRDINQIQIDKFASLAIDMISGKSLSEDEERQLLAIRTKLN